MFECCEVRCFIGFSWNGLSAKDLYHQAVITGVNVENIWWMNAEIVQMTLCQWHFCVEKYKMFETTREVYSLNIYNLVWSEIEFISLNKGAGYWSCCVCMSWCSGWSDDAADAIIQCPRIILIKHKSIFLLLFLWFDLHKTHRITWIEYINIKFYSWI